MQRTPQPCGSTSSAIHTATGRKKSWDEDTYEMIDWKHFGKCFKQLSIGQKIQISKYTNDLLPTNRRLQMLLNTKDG
jgi:uridine kinase